MPNRKQSKTLLTGFSTTAENPQTPHTVPDWRYCRQRTGPGALPCCPLLENLVNNNELFNNVIVPDDYWKPFDDADERPRYVQIIDKLVTVLDWWIHESVQPDKPVFWYYVYTDNPCRKRLPFITPLLDLFIQLFKYDFPAITSELKEIITSLIQKCREFDADVKLSRYRGSIRIDVDGMHIFNPSEVKEAAACLREELIDAKEYLEGESHKKDHRTDFQFLPGQIIYDGRIVSLSVGRRHEILEKLVRNRGKVVRYEDLDSSCVGKPTEQMRSDIAMIRKALKAAKTSSTITAKRTVGYILETTR